MKTTLLLTLMSLAIPAIVGCVGAPVRVRADDRPPSPPPSEKETADRVAKVIALHNRERIKAKQSSLSPSPRLTKAAQRHALDMAERNAMSHKGSDGSTSGERIKDAGYSFKRVAENVAFGRFSPDDLMEGWMNSPPHKKNILGGYSQIGAACAIAEDGTTYWCVTFGLPDRK